MEGLGRPPDLAARDRNRLWQEAHLAHISGHLSPQSLAKELAQLDGEVSVYITHPKPGEVPAVLAQILALDTRHRIEPLREGQRFGMQLED